MHAKIPLFSLATTLTVGCSVDSREQSKELETETATEAEDNQEEDTDTGDTQDTGSVDDTAEDTDTQETDNTPSINGSWSLSSSENICNPYYDYFCGHFTEFTLEIENEELLGSSIVFSVTYDTDTTSETLNLNAFSAIEEGSYSINLSLVQTISFSLTCVLSDETLECSGRRSDYELDLQATLQKS